MVARARRYPLSRDERAQLDEHVAGCPTCRMAQDIGADFDAIAGVRPGDGALIFAIADGLTPGRRRMRGGRGSAGKFAVAAAAVCALLGAAAGAYALIGRREALSEPAAETSRQRVSRAAPEEIEVLAHDAPREGRVDADEAPRTAPVQHRVHARAPAHAIVAAASPSAPESAADLFTSANTERRLGHAGQAIALYDDLEQRYPATEEARAARVSLGKLLLARGESAVALHQLEAYLSSSPDGTLAPEALFGEAQALEQLRRSDEERSTWQRLVARFPDSVYAAQARRRLQDLR
jgi:TolA-binding protein